MSRAFKIIAAVSVAINVLAFGYAAGLLVHHSPMEILTRKQHHLLDLLPADQAKALNPVLVKGLDEQREAIARIHDLRSRLLQLMRAETYDETAFRSALQDLERERGALFNSVTNLLLAVARNLDIDGRNKLASRLEHLPIPAGPPSEQHR